MNQEMLEELNTRLETVEAQRNRALMDHAITAGRLSVANKNLAAALERAEKAEARITFLEALRQEE